MFLCACLHVKSSSGFWFIASVYALTFPVGVKSGDVRDANSPPWGTDQVVKKFTSQKLSACFVDSVCPSKRELHWKLLMYLFSPCSKSIQRLPCSGNIWFWQQGRSTECRERQAGCTCDAVTRCNSADVYDMVIDVGMFLTCFFNDFYPRSYKGTGSGYTSVHSLFFLRLDQLPCLVYSAVPHADVAMG